MLSLPRTRPDRDGTRVPVRRADGDRRSASVEPERFLLHWRDDAVLFDHHALRGIRTL